MHSTECNILHYKRITARIAEHGWGCRTYSRMLVWRCRSDQRRRRRRACTTRSWRFVAAQYRTRTLPDRTSDALRTSSSPVQLAERPTSRRHPSASHSQSAVPAGLSTLPPTWWPIDVLNWPAAVKYRTRRVVVTAVNYRSACFVSRQPLQPTAVY